ncbi:MAG: phosphoglucosamine mutase [Bacillota bacterium]|nr:phosphoglucosamine mutase [Bacillota bacterium]MDK2925728.1 phosphoglucosamine mutase [Bacillota bacterium]
MGRLFGTDGVRGVANADLTPELAFALGRAGAYVLTDGRERSRLVVGRDTRRSGEMLEAALTAGILSVGGEVLSVGVLPTPAIAYLTRALGADAGVVISASHNPVEDNGIKFFSAEGYKLPDATEDRIEALLGEANLPRPTGAGVGIRRSVADAGEMYLKHLRETLGADLSGLKIVVDVAHGAAYQVAPELLRCLGAELTVLNDAPTGVNINVNCGSTHPEGLQKAVRELKADVGLAFDGDADRLIAVDERGEVVDGDQIMAVLALAQKEKGRLKGEGLVATSMSNMGLELVLKKHGLLLVRTQVGDRYVLEELLNRGWNLGGEQSGHIINLNYNTTGDGLSTALQLLAVLVEKKVPLSDLAAIMPRLPQLMVNVPVRQKEGWKENTKIAAAVAGAEKALKGRGRVVVRPSGTEPLMRVMVEGEDAGLLRQIAEEIAAVIAAELG